MTFEDFKGQCGLNDASWHKDDIQKIIEDGTMVTKE